MALKHKKREFSEWYPEIVQVAGLGDYSAVGGCMVIRPYGYAIWEKIQAYFDKKIKESGHVNAYFPLFIPEKFLKKEAEHFKGFVPEVAWIERKDKNEERYALRPTSETIMYDSYSKWIRSWRDLPVLINQWCNTVRWETAVTRLFLRTREFLWQEGHTAHATEKEADKEVMDILEKYKDLMETQLAVPVLIGKKTEAEKFPGALYTATLEALMPNGKALQMGTSHNLGQHFAKVFDIKFLDKDEKEKYVWQTSWGISTRLVGSIVMVHGDDKGLVLPPRLAPTQAVIVPILFEKNKKKTLKAAEMIKKKLKDFPVKLDDRDEYSAGWKFNEWEMKGVPLRIEIGPKDIQKNQAILVRRDTGARQPVKISQLEKSVQKILGDIQKNLFTRAKKFLTSKTVTASTFKELEKEVKNKSMVKTSWCGNPGCEEKIKDKTGATIRLIPFKKDGRAGKCIVCAKKAKEVVYVAKAY